MIEPEGQGLLAVQAAATLFLTGLIWFVQIAHYPLLDRVGRPQFVRYHQGHSRLTTRVVALPMLVEAAASLTTVLRPPPQVPVWQAWLGLALVALIWISTATLQVPQHRRLGAGFEASAHRRLVRWNWVRVVGWSLRAVLVVGWLS